VLKLDGECKYQWFNPAVEEVTPGWQLIFGGAVHKRAPRTMTDADLEARRALKAAMRGSCMIVNSLIAGGPYCQVPANREQTMAKSGKMA